MDKSFVNIDDLVRQRLGGGEEQEQSGSWMRMRELLDKEMPQEKRTGIFYWRRMMSAVAVLLLIATISVGGYELSAHRNANNPAANDAAGTPVSANLVNTPASNNEVNNNQLSATGTTDNAPVKNEEQSHKKLLAANDNHITTATNDSKTTSPKVSGNEAGKNAMPVASNNKASDNRPVTENVLVNATGNQSVVNKSAAPKNATPAVNMQNDKTGLASKAAAPVANVAGKHANTAPGTKEVVKGTQPANNDVAKVNKTDQKVPKNNSVNSGTKTEKMEALALSSHAPLPENVKTPSLHKMPVQHTGADKAAKASGKTTLNSHTVAAKNTNIAAINTGKPLVAKKAVMNTGKTITAKETVVNAEKAVAVKKPAMNAGSPIAAKKLVAAKETVKGNNTTGNKVASIAPAGKAVTGQPQTGNLPLSAGVPVAAKPVAVDNAAIKKAFALNAKKDKKVIQKLILFAHYISTAPDGHDNLDTISLKTLSEELGLAEDNPLSPVAKIAAKGTAGNGTNNTLAANENAANSPAVANSKIVPGAAASSNSNSLTTSQKEYTGSKKSGATALENLSSAFNDIKYQASGMQFAAGLKGGINGTFFGPSSFNGFQFGVTGDFIFGNDWSFATELAYFHRINSNYALADNYYSYTQNGSGYNKEQQQNLYSFSTLHSIELPLIIRYSAGKFNFFVGGNIVYTFSINTGAAPQPSTGAITYSATKGNDDAPQLSAADFNSRFGFGCLFGVSYKVAPNVTLDLRNVMTLWDNANSQGEKYVSDQLYKSPSLQLSLGYRLGGHKTKD